MIDNIFTIGFVVIKSAYLLNCVCPWTPGIKSWRFPTKCPTKKVTKNKPEREASTFLKMVDVK